MSTHCLLPPPSLPWPWLPLAGDGGHRVCGAGRPVHPLLLLQAQLHFDADLLQRKIMGAAALTAAALTAAAAAAAAIVVATLATPPPSPHVGAVSVLVEGICLAVALLWLTAGPGVGALVRVAGRGRRPAWRNLG